MAVALKVRPGSICIGSNGEQRSVGATTKDTLLTEPPVDLPLNPVPVTLPEPVAPPPISTTVESSPTSQQLVPPSLPTEIVFSPFDGSENLVFPVGLCYFDGVFFHVQSRDARPKIIVAGSIPEKSITAQFRMPAYNASPRSLLFCLLTRKKMGGGGSFLIRTTDEHLMLFRFDSAEGALGFDASDYDVLIEFCRKLIYLEDQTHSLLGPMQREISADCIETVDQAARLLSSSQIDHPGLTFTFPVGPEMARSLVKALAEQTSNLSFRPSTSQIEVFGLSVEVGETVWVIDQPAFSSPAHQLEISTQLATADGTDTLRLEVVSSTRGVTQQLLQRGPALRRDPVLPSLVEICRSVLGTLQAATEATLSLRVVGKSGSGKTSLLRMLRDELMACGLVSILVSPPPGRPDSGLIAMAQIADVLEQQGLELGCWRLLENAPPGDQLTLLRSWLETHGRDVVLLLDEPATWAPSAYASGHIGSDIQSIVTLLSGLNCHRIVAEQSGPSDYEILPQFNAGDWLLDSQSWGILAGAAKSLNQAKGEVLERLTPTQVRLMVALTAISGTVPEMATTFELLQNLRHTAMEERKALAGLWAKATLLGIGVTDTVIEALGASELSDEDKAILYYCLSPRLDGLHSVSDAVAFDLAESSVASEYHSLLADCLNANRPAHDCRNSVVVWQLEKFYHQAKASRSESWKTEPHSRHNLRVAMHLAEAAGDPRAVVALSDELLRDGQRDHYSHFAVASALQALGENPQRIEELFRIAIDLERREPRYWCSLICFYLIRGRVLDAERQWSMARENFAGRSRAKSLGSILHLPIISLCLARSQFDFAEEVWNDIPEVWAQDNKHAQALRRRLDALQESELSSNIVPLQFSGRQWWQQGPFVDRAPPSEGLRLIRWLPGRLASLDENLFTFRVASVLQPPPAHSPVQAQFTVDEQTLASWELTNTEKLKVGSFVEFYEFSSPDPDDERVAVRALLHRVPDVWSEPDLPDLPKTDAFLSKYASP